MTHTKKFILLGMMFVSSTMLCGQSSPGSSGGQASGSGGSVSHTIGQMAYSFVSDNGSVSQGIQHPFEILVITSITENRIGLSSYVYPNPTMQGIMLETQNPIEEKLNFALYDVNGHVLLEHSVMEIQVYIPMEKYNSGPYFLKVTGRNNQVKVFKVIKK